MELINAEIIDGLAQRYHQLPSQILNEPANILKMIAIVEEGQETSKK
jgi:hypothetical protein